VEDSSGEKIVNSKMQAGAKIPRQKVQQMQNMRETERISEKIRDLPNLLQKPGA
jgi:hypothetical protein